LTKLVLVMFGCYTEPWQTLRGLFFFAKKGLATFGCTSYPNHV
jgi:hypothetical protein